MSSATRTNQNTDITLNNGVKMPAIGLGTYRIRNYEAIMSTVDYALEAGYRLFDTAAVYGNENHLKKALQKFLPKYGLERKDIFITTKLSPSDQGCAVKTESGFLRSLDNLGLEYVDLFLIHFPGAAGIPAGDPMNRQMRTDSWAKLVELYHAGKARAIGVSNYTVRHLTELMNNNYGVNPAVNQVEFHPHFFQSDLLEFCKSNDIVVQGYCSFGGTSANEDSLITEPSIVAIAQKLNVSVPQLLLAWSLQHGVAVIPKSTNKDHIQNNLNINFTIPKSDMDTLNNLSVRVKYAWDPERVV